jgi:hypothetical protein
VARGDLVLVYVVMQPYQVLAALLIAEVAPCSSVKYWSVVQHTFVNGQYLICRHWLLMFMCQDVIAPEYLAELELLQDRIAPFSTELALNIIEQELGVPVEHLFSEISPQPVAAASLGQVYQARLRPSGESVDVKVQRPGVRAAMALDLFILRKMVDYARALLRLNTDLAVTYRSQN